MLIRLTNRCHMACSHCFIDATPDGEHMTTWVYERALEWSSRHDISVLLSGGEPTEHPMILEWIRRALAAFDLVTVASNGSFLDDLERARALFETGAHWQITNDARFYPTPIRQMVVHDRAFYVDRLPTVVRLGRYTGRSNRLAPMCYNLRSAVRAFGSLGDAIRFLRLQNKHCTPSIDIDGTLRAGESPLCYPIGTIQDTDRDFTERLKRHDCDRCGLHAKLSPRLRDWVGYSPPGVG